MGWVGKHGLLITPEFGSRVRLAAVYTNIENLPYTESDTHGWIDDYCKVCGVCSRQCPPKAILDEPVIHETGRITHVSQRGCFEYFAQYYGCSVCIKVCPFSQRDDAYDRLRAIVNQFSYSPVFQLVASPEDAVKMFNYFNPKLAKRIRQCYDGSLVNGKDLMKIEIKPEDITVKTNR